MVLFLIFDVVTDLIDGGSAHGESSGFAKPEDQSIFTFSHYLQKNL